MFSVSGSRGWTFWDKTKVLTVEDFLQNLDENDFF